MPNVRPEIMNKPKRIAILCSDLHLSLQRPTCRADDDWLAVQAHYLEQLRKAAYSVSGDLPVLCAGDIFDRWNPPPELIVFALENLPDGMICVPGQHDLPNHRLDQMYRSAYGVLHIAGKIIDVAGTIICEDDVTITGFGWGDELHPKEGDFDGLHIALVHKYCWMKDHKYPGAPEDCKLSIHRKSLRGYDAIAFGDNHKGFLAKGNIINCGGFIRRKSDEIDYRPAIGILYSDGSIEREFLDTSIDKFHEKEELAKGSTFDLKEFIDGLESLGEQDLNFREAVENHLRSEEVDDEVKSIILKSMEEQ